MEAALVGALLNLIPLVGEKLREELKLFSDATTEFDGLEQLIGEIENILKKTYLMEVIDERLKPCIKRMLEFLCDSEDAIEDSLRSVSSFRHRLNNRTFTVKSREIQKMWRSYNDNLRRTDSVCNFLGLPINHAQSSSARYGSSSKAFFDNADSLVGIERPKNRLVRLLTENSSTSKVIFVHGAQGVGKTSLVAAVLHHPSVGCRFKYCVWIEDLRSRELSKDKEAEPLRPSAATMWKLTMEEWSNHPQHIELGKAFDSIMKDEDLKANNSVGFSSWMTQAEPMCSLSSWVV